MHDFWTSETIGGQVNLTWSLIQRTSRNFSLFLSLLGDTRKQCTVSRFCRNWSFTSCGATVRLHLSWLEINGGPVARIYQKSCRTTNPSEAVVRWATKILPVNITFVSFFTAFAVAVTATMLFVFNISTGHRYLFVSSHLATPFRTCTLIKHL